jgi:hypothetical protein
VEAYIKGNGGEQLHEAAAEVQAFLRQQRASNKRRAAQGRGLEAASAATPRGADGQGADGQEPVAPAKDQQEPVAPAEDQKKKHWQAPAPGAGDLTAKDVQGFLPPTFKVYEDMGQGRFRGTCAGGVYKDQKSFSWSTRGRAEAASLLLRWAWDTRARHIAATSGAALCPHTGIFAEDA